MILRYIFFKKKDDLEMYVHTIERTNDNWKVCIVTVITEDRNMLHIVYIFFCFKINMLIFHLFKKLGEEDRASNVPLIFQSGAHELLVIFRIGVHNVLRLFKVQTKTFN